MELISLIEFLWTTTRASLLPVFFLFSPMLKINGTLNYEFRPKSIFTFEQYQMYITTKDQMITPVLPNTSIQSIDKMKAAIAIMVSNSSERWEVWCKSHFARIYPVVSEKPIVPSFNCPSTIWDDYLYIYLYPAFIIFTNNWRWWTYPTHFSPIFPATNLWGGWAKRE